MPHPPRHGPLDDDDRARLRGRFGDAVRPWLDELDELVAATARRWGVTPTGRARAGGTSVIVPGTTERGAVVLKLSPEPALADEEARALRAWASCAHVVDLHAADEARGVLLLDAVDPGTPLADGWELPDVLPLLADLMTVPAPTAPTGLADITHRVDSMFDLARRRLGPSDPAIGPLLPVGHARARALAADPVVAGVVHGDLHARNVLRAADHRGAVAIDPRPSIGDRHLDLVDWVLTPDVADAQALDARLRALADGVPGLDPERARAWSVALAPLVLMPLVAHDPGTRRVRFLLDLAARDGEDHDP